MDERTDADATPEAPPPCRTCDGEEGLHHRDCPDRDTGSAWDDRMPEGES